ncbi:uncharacterized protein LOC134719351 [Mytilus trossulus]|uniref:uncharacterized protein LOC134719351 n=1 Tax=Mytilus trossulus TaxID=6551 RepID=UPI0030041E9E
MMTVTWYGLIVIIGIHKTHQHGYLADPPQRSSVWRENPDAPVNYNDNQLYCGGRENMRLHGGKCGTCGDPYQGPRENEAGGKYARGIITRKYPSYKRKLPVKIVLTAYHKGYYEFKICSHNNPNSAVSQRCLDRHPLRIVEGSRRYRTRYYPNDSGVHHMTLLLPRDMKCTQCVLQWRYRTGNSWGTNSNGHGCIGCGNQEEFWNCADIQIGYNTRYKDISKTFSHSGDSSDDDSNIQIGYNNVYKDTSQTFPRSGDSSDDYSDNQGHDTLKQAGITILNHFFSPFDLYSNKHSITSQKDKITSPKNEISSLFLQSVNKGNINQKPRKSSMSKLSSVSNFGRTDQKTDQLSKNRILNNVNIGRHQIQKSNILQKYVQDSDISDDSSDIDNVEESNNIEIDNSFNLQKQNPRNPFPTTKTSEIQNWGQTPTLTVTREPVHPPLSPWYSLFGGNHGNVQVSFVPDHDLKLLHLFGK